MCLARQSCPSLNLKSSFLSYTFWVFSWLLSFFLDSTRSVSLFLLPYERVLMWCTLVRVYTWLAMWRHDTVTLLAIVTGIREFEYSSTSTFHIANRDKEGVTVTRVRSVNYKKTTTITRHNRSRYTWNNWIKATKCKHTRELNTTRWQHCLSQGGSSSRKSCPPTHTSMSENSRRYTNFVEQFNIKCTNRDRVEFRVPTRHRIYSWSTKFQLSKLRQGDRTYHSTLERSATILPCCALLNLSLSDWMFIFPCLLPRCFLGFWLAESVIPTIFSYVSPYLHHLTQYFQ